MNLIMYVRKSSESEDRQVMSIEGQTFELARVLERAGHTLVGEPVAEEMSAKQPGRPLFAAVLERIENGEADGILCWHLDRLARNPKDGGAIMQDLSDGKLKAVVTPDRTYTGTADDKLMMSIIFGMATKYSDDLARNVKRGYSDALRRGRWPCSLVPIGYMRDLATGDVVPDPERWDKVEKLWRLHLNGTPVVSIIDIARNELKLTSRPVRGHRRSPDKRANARLPELVSRPYVYAMLHNPFYCGLMRCNGKLYPGTHRAMVTLDEFSSVNSSQPKPPKRDPGKFLDIPYRGKLLCATCGHTVTPERQVKANGKIYYYYRCTTARRDGDCEESAVTLSEINEQFAEFFDKLTFPRPILDFLFAELSAVEIDCKQLSDQAEHRQAKRRAEIAVRRQRVTEGYLSGALSAEDAAAERARLDIVDRESITEPPIRTDELRVAAESVRTAISSLNNLRSRFESAAPNEKSALVGAVCSNGVLGARKLDILAKEPFQTLHDLPRDLSWWASGDNARKAIRQLFDSISGTDVPIKR